MVENSWVDTLPCYGSRFLTGELLRIQTIWNYRDVSETFDCQPPRRILPFTLECLIWLVQQTDMNFFLVIRGNLNLSWVLTYCNINFAGLIPLTYVNKPSLHFSGLWKWLEERSKNLSLTTMVERNLLNHLKWLNIS